MAEKGLPAPTPKSKKKFPIAGHTTGGSHLSHTVVKPDSRLAQIFIAKFLCIIKLIIIIE